jgi:hypothetical protein
LSNLLHMLAWLAGTPLFTTLGCSLAFAASLRTLIVCATAGLGKNAILLNFAVKLLEGQLKGVARVHFDLTHGPYQRDLRSLDRPEP